MVLCVVAAVCYAAGVVFQKPALRPRLGRPGDHVRLLRRHGGAACRSPGSWCRSSARRRLGDTLNVVYLGLFPTMLGFTTWAYALARTPSGKMGATTYAVPGLVVVMSWLILGQVPGWLTLAGGALCLAGVAVTRSRSARKAVPALPVAVAAEGQPR